MFLYRRWKNRLESLDNQRVFLWVDNCYKLCACMLRIIKIVKALVCLVYYDFSLRFILL